MTLYDRVMQLLWDHYDGGPMPWEQIEQMNCLEFLKLLSEVMENDSQVTE